VVREEKQVVQSVAERTKVEVLSPLDMNSSPLKRSHYVASCELRGFLKCQTPEADGILITFGAWDYRSLRRMNILNQFITKHLLYGSPRNKVSFFLKHHLATRDRK
jgi:hypothetical protein